MNKGIFGWSPATPDFNPAGYSIDYTVTGSGSIVKNTPIAPSLFGCEYSLGNITIKQSGTYTITLKGTESNGNNLNLYFYVNGVSSYSPGAIQSTTTTYTTTRILREGDIVDFRTNYTNNLTAVITNSLVTQ
jgi:hypothetical protein